MIDKKISELINKEIDGVITPSEKLRLDQYIINNPDARKLYDELINIDKNLDLLPDNEPDENLKKHILNSIDINRYAKPQKKDFRKIIKSFIPAPKILITFSLGAAVCLIVISALFRTPDIFNSFESDDVSGTIGLSNSRLIESVPVAASGIEGNIEILRGYDASGHISEAEMNHIQLNINLEASEKFTIKLRFNTKEGNIEDFSCSGPSEFSLEEGTLNIKSATEHKSTFIVSFGNKIPDHMELSLFRNDQELYKQFVVIEEE
jgi:hypothetical protein